MMTSEMMVAMMGSMAQEESISISNNVGGELKKGRCLYASSGHMAANVNIKCRFYGK